MFKKLAYGTVIVASAVTTGTLVWWRSAEEQARIKAVDWVEVYQAAQERRIATRIRTNEASPRVLTNLIDTAGYSTDDPSGRFYFPSGSEESNVYKIASGSQRFTFIATNPTPGTFNVVPWTSWSVMWTNTGQKYIRGPYQTLTVSGWVPWTGGSEGFSPNGTFAFSENRLDMFYPKFPASPLSRGIITEYTNVAGGGVRYFDFNGAFGGEWEPWDTNLPSGWPTEPSHNDSTLKPDASAGAAFVPWDYVHPEDGDPIGWTWGFVPAPLNPYSGPQYAEAGYGPWDTRGNDLAYAFFFGLYYNVNVTPGALITNETQLTDAWVTAPTSVRNMIYNQPFWSDFLRMVGTVASAVSHEVHDKTAYDGVYLDHTLADGSVFIGVTNVNLPSWTISNLFAEGSIGGVSNGGTFWSYQLSNRPGRLVLQDLTEVYTGLELLQWTHVAKEGNYEWIAPEGEEDNHFVWQSDLHDDCINDANPGPDLAALYATVLADPQLSGDPTSSTRSGGPPYTTVRASRSGTPSGGCGGGETKTYMQVTKTAHQAQLVVSGLAADLVHTVDGYMKAVTAYEDNPAWGSNLWDNFSFDPELVPNAFTYLETIASSVNSESVTSSVLGQSSSPVGVAQEPSVTWDTSSGENNYRGFVMSLTDAVIKWDFEYADTALP